MAAQERRAETDRSPAPARCLEGLAHGRHPACPDRTRRRRTRGLPLLVIAAVVSMGAGPRDALLRARQAYNQQQYDAAIEAATEAQRVAASADAAALVLARARLERFRQKGSADDPAAARDGFIRLDSSRLTPRERQELLVGLGEVLFLDERYGAAAEQFNLALSRSDPAAPGAWRTLEWWASALDRQAQLEPGVDQELLYAPVLQRMEDELRGNAASAVASYWLSAAARGVGDLPRAWDAAVAGWVRAPLSGDQREALRADLDRLVLQAIIPEASPAVGIRQRPRTGGRGASGRLGTDQAAVDRPLRADRSRPPHPNY